MNSKTHIAVLILAAGGSRRMGKSKQLLKWNNTDFVNHAIETADRIGQGQIYIVLGSNAERIKTSISGKDVTIVLNDHWEKGLGMSLSRGVKAIKKCNSSVNGILIMLSDQPLINSDYLTEMVRTWSKESPQIVATEYDNGNFGVPAIFGEPYFNALEKLSDDRGAKQIITDNLENVTCMNASHMILDIDTPEDYARLLDINRQL